MSDSISKQAAIDVIRQWSIPIYLSNEGDYVYSDEVTAICKILEALPPAQSEIIRCKECKHFHYNMPYVIQGIPVLGHEVCDFWDDGCKTNENGFCSYAERREE